MYNRVTNYRSRIFFFLFVVVVCPILIFGQQKATKPQPCSLSYERTGCFGSCPGYRIDISRKGELQYLGREFVKVKGRASDVLSAEQLRDIKGEIEGSKFFALRNSYVQRGCTSWATDNPTVIITMTVGTQKKKIRHYLGCRAGSDEFTKELERLKALEAAIEKILNVQKWIGTREERRKLANPS